MSSATEAKLGALYIMAREAVYIQIILKEMGHKQPPTPLQTDNSMADGVVNGKYNQSEQWTCDSTGCETENVKNNSEYIGAQEN